MAATEDELAKQRVQEAIWTWTGRMIVLLVTFGFGFFAAWILWGSGVSGAPVLRQRVEQMEGQINDLKKQRQDIDGQKVVFEGRLNQCLTDLQKARAAQSAPQAQ
ncbi:MAG TPA: hypothetical protein VKA21_01240 [Candidatus Binatia bacterium]|nr:hypothetical protein [Candidatus Binatia bacterium]